MTVYAERAALSVSLSAYFFLAFLLYGQANSLSGNLLFLSESSSVSWRIRVSSRLLEVLGIRVLDILLTR